MHANKTMIAGAIAAALFTIGSAQAAESVTTDDVKVTATRVEKDLSDVNMSVSVITAEDIKHSSARNIGELLQDIPGIEINPDGGQGMKRVNIRGENGFRTLIVIDGQKMSDHKVMSGTPILIDPSQIERIEVIKGPASVLYGSEAIGGVINIITKKGGDRPLEANVSAGYSTEADGVSGSADIAGAYNGWKYRLGAAYEDHDDLDTPAGKMPNTDFNSKTASAFLSYDITPDATVGLSLDHYDLEFHSSAIGQEGFKVDVPEWNRSRAAFFAEVRNVNDVLQRVRADVFYQQSEKEFLNTISMGAGMSTRGMNMIPTSIQPGADNTTKQYGVSLQTDWQLNESNYLVAGYEFNYDDMDARSRTVMNGLFAMEGFPLMPFTQVVKDESYDGYQASHAIFASMETALDNDLTLNYGVRYTYVESEVDTLVNANNFYSKEKKGTRKHGDSNDGKAVFNAGILWNGIENLTLRASWSQGYRSPLLQDLYVPADMGGTDKIVVGNPDLKSETSNNFEIGARWNDGRTNIDAAAFYSVADDYIARRFWKHVVLEGAQGVPMPKDFYRPENVEEAKTFGFELAASTLIGQTNFEPYLNLTLMKRQYDNGVGHKTWKTSTPFATAVYGVRWHGETNGMNVRWDAYARSQSKNESEDADEKITTYAGYTTFNLKGGLDFGARHQYSVDFGLYNVFDKLYQHQGAIYEPGRYAAVKFNAAF